MHIRRRDQGRFGVRGRGEEKIVNATTIAPNKWTMLRQVVTAQCNVLDINEFFSFMIVKC